MSKKKPYAGGSGAGLSRRDKIQGIVLYFYDMSNKKPYAGGSGAGLEGSMSCVDRRESNRRCYGTVA